MTINNMARRAYTTSKAKGFIRKEPQIDRKLLLAIGEIVEAQNEIRSGHKPTEIYLNHGKPEGFPIEVADAIIRLGQLCHQLGINLDKAIRIKMDYNDTRPYKHGKRF